MTTHNALALITRSRKTSTIVTVDDDQCDGDGPLSAIRGESRS